MARAVDMFNDKTQGIILRDSTVELCREVEDGQTTILLTDKRGDERRVTGHDRGAGPWHDRRQFHRFGLPAVSPPLKTRPCPASELRRCSSCPFELVCVIERVTCSAFITDFTCPRYSADVMPSPMAKGETAPNQRFCSTFRA